MARYDLSVFVNCPFDAGYRPLFDAILFTLLDLGFEPRCALEADDGAEVRLVKIERIIEQCRYGIHDLSAVELDAVTGLPRFNMPLELGLFLGCRRFGGNRHTGKSALILDGQPYRYRAFLSDISGQDIHAHGQDPHRAVRESGIGLRPSRDGGACREAPRLAAATVPSRRTFRICPPGCGEIRSN